MSRTKHVTLQVGTSFNLHVVYLDTTNETRQEKKTCKNRATTLVSRFDNYLTKNKLTDHTADSFGPVV